MKKLGFNVNLVINYVTRIETHENIDYIVVPVVMMVEGVHSGSQGPILYTIADLTQSASLWNGYPVVVNHPTDMNGDYILASEANSSERIGTIHNSRMEGDALKADLRINISDLSDVSSETLESIRNQSPLNVSIGVLGDNEIVEGEFNNQHYNAIARNLRPDHLALLPDSEGACSMDDGCGIRNSKIKLNKSKTKPKNNEVVERNKLTIKQMHNKLLQNGFVIKELDNSELIQNEMGFHEISNNIQNKLDTFDNEGKYHYLEEVFPDGSFVYVVRNRDSRTTIYYRRTYEVNDGQITFLDDAVQVLREVSYPVVLTPNLNKLIRTKKPKENKEIMDNEKVSSCKVDALIANEASKFTGDDREFLLGLDEATFNKLAPEPKKEVVDNKKKEDPVVVEPTKEVTALAVKAFFEEVKTPEAFIELMPGDLGAQMKEGLKLRTNQRKTLIEGIVANSKFIKETLENWDNEALETMYKSVVEEDDESDFSLNGEAGEIANNNKPGIAMKSMLNLKTKEEKK